MRRYANYNRKKIFGTVMLILFILSIFMILFFSSKPAEESNRTSRWLTQRICDLFGNDFDGSLHYTVRESAHFAEYAVLGAAACGFFMTAVRRRWASAFVSAAFCSLFSVFDEAVQLFSDGRSPGWFDVAIDILGSVFGILIVFMLYWLYSKMKRRGAGANQ